MAYKYLQKENSKLFSLKLPGFISNTPYEMLIKSICLLIPGLSYSDINLKLLMYHLSVPLLSDFLKARIPEEVDNYIFKAEEDTDTKPYSREEREKYFAQVHLPIIELKKDEYIRGTIRKVMYFILGMLPTPAQDMVRVNLAKLGQTIDTIIPLFEGRGSRNAYKQVGFGLSIEMERILISCFRFLKENTGGDPTISFSPAIDQYGNNIVLVDVILKKEGEESRRTMHFPEIVNWVEEILDNIQKNPQQPLQLAPHPENSHDSHE